MRQGFSWTQLSVGRVRTGAVRDLFGVGKCHEFDQFGGSWSGLGLGVGSQLVAVRWVNGSPVGADLPPVGAVGWSVVEQIVRSVSGITPPKW